MGPGFGTCDVPYDFESNHRPKKVQTESNTRTANVLLLLLPVFMPEVPELQRGNPPCISWIDHRHHQAHMRDVLQISVLDKSWSSTEQPAVSTGVHS